MTKKDDKRRHDRFSAEDVRGSFSYAVEASVLNISLGGLAVHTQTQLRIGRQYRFQIGGLGERLQLAGTVRWCRLAGTERVESGDIVPLYEAGISFDDVLTDKAEDLIQFMERNIIVDLKKRVTGRFRLPENSPVVLESDSRFEVKQLSLSGMMIESEVALKPDTRLQLEMKLARRNFASAGRIIYLAEINVDEGELRYRLGVEFIGTGDDMSQLLERFIRTELERAEKLAGAQGSTWEST